MKRIILHIDVNSAYLSWTAVSLLNNGSKYDIRDGYTVIGGDETKRSGVVLARSNSSKKIGIKTGETLYKARKKCSVLRSYPPNFKLYEEMSNKLFDYIREYTPDVEVTSIDECFVDYGKVKKLYGDEVKFAHYLKNKIQVELGFTVNIGIGNNKLCAKMASDFSKPNKVHTLYEEEVESKLYPLPVNRLYGVGKKTTIKLNELNINTIGELANYDASILYKYLKNQAYKLIDSAKGKDDSPVISEYIPPKGISNSVTLEHDYTSKKALYKVINKLVDNVSFSLRQEKRYASVVAIILRDSEFNTKTHQIKLKNATNVTLEINQITKKLFDDLWGGYPVRLIGVRLDNLVESRNYQLSIFECVEEIDDKSLIDETVDDINKKYGISLLKTASLVNENEKRN